MVTSSSRHEFTLRHLLKRKFGTANKSIREAIIGEESFAGCIMKYFNAEEKLKSVRCVPSASRPGPGKLGYYNGGFIVKKHAKINRVDSLQIELPMSVRSQAGPVREAAILALAGGIKMFHDLHYAEAQTEAQTEADTDRHVNGNYSSKPSHLSLSGIVCPWETVHCSVTITMFRWTARDGPL